MDMLDGRALSAKSLISVTGVMSANLLLHAGDVTREGLSRMQTVVDIARENFDKPDSPPIYFARQLREGEESKQATRELREELLVVKADKNLQNKKLKAAKQKLKVVKRRQLTHTNRRQAVFDSRIWKILTFLYRIRKKIWFAR